MESGIPILLGLFAQVMVIVHRCTCIYIYSASQCYDIMFILPTQHNTDKDHQNFTNTAATEIYITDRNGQNSGDGTTIMGTKPLYNLHALPSHEYGY